MPAKLFPKFLANALGGEIAGDSYALDWLSDTIKVALHTSSFTPAVADELFSDTDNEVEGTGYDAGGATLGTKTLTYVAAANATAWQAGTAYAVGDIVRKTTTNGHVYICTVAGTSHAVTEPTWPTTAFATVTDGTVTWMEYGQAYISLDAANVTWANSTITARYATIYKSGSIVIGYQDFGEDKVSVEGNFTITWPAVGIITFGVQ